MNRQTAIFFNNLHYEVVQHDILEYNIESAIHENLSPYLEYFQSVPCFSILSRNAFNILIKKSNDEVNEEIL